jgi:hypothetical protein
MPHKSGPGDTDTFVGAVGKEPRGGDGIPCGDASRILESGLKGGDGGLVTGTTGSVDQHDAAAVGATDSFTQNGGK